jgi:integrase
MSAEDMSGEELEAARVLLARLGVRPEDLVRQPVVCRVVPTFAEYIPIVSAAVGAGTRRVYSSYWNRVLAQWGDRRLDEPSPSEIKQLGERIKTQVVRRRNGRGGRCAVEHLIAALRCVYRHAEADGLISKPDNPARKVDKPRRLPSTRRGLADARLAEINQVVAGTGNDPGLDALLVRLHVETACRRGGALALRPVDLDPVQCVITLREKGDTWREQPVSPTLMRHLQAHAVERGATGEQPLFRTVRGDPVTRRRYDYLWRRVREALPWAQAAQVSTHWLRHTTLTWVERRFGYAVARAYAGHTDTGPGSGVGTTATYVRADVVEVATALAALTGEPHPLAPSEESGGA